MKVSNLSKLVGLGALSLSLTALPMALPVSAQTAPAPDSPTTTVQDNDDGFDLGWLGLLGLLGLAGLAGKKRRDEPARYQDPNVAARSEYRQ
ncbi:MAG: hypothetical protein HC866_10125 [Leptolyngbyaceae cyanobacterium RU_5_1]|nr:hypothetical protein [Leptolyngbyaceae cyanobacterium RU_5_1]